MAVDDQGDFGYRASVEAIYGSLMDLVVQRFISGAEMRRMVIPTVGRSRKDFLAPFQETGTFAGLTLEELEIFYGEDRIWKEFEEHGDADRFGKLWAAFSRASVGPTLASALEDRTVRTAEFLARLESKMAARLAASPEKTSIPLAKMVLVKKSMTA
jgi:hypothetical protein